MFGTFSWFPCCQCSELCHYWWRQYQFPLGLMDRDWNFSGFARRKFFLYHASACHPWLVRSESTASWVFPVAYSWWWSAYIVRFGSPATWYDLSFWNMFHNSGTSAILWGQPRSIVCHSLMWSLIFTLLNLLCKKDLIKSNELLPNR